MSDREYLNRETKQLMTESAAKRQWEKKKNSPNYSLSFSEQYEMIRFMYGMKSRGFSIGCQPKEGFLGRLDDPKGKYYDILVYDRRLDDEEVSEFELEFIDFEFDI